MLSKRLLIRLLGMGVPALMLLAFAAPAAAGTDLLVNGGFEAGVSPDGPQGWSWETSRPGAAWFLTDAKVHGGKRALVIRSKTPVDARFHQGVPVKPETFYKLSGWIATEDVTVDLTGAVLSLRGTFHHTATINDTKDWTYVEIFFRTDKGQNEVSIAARLGMWGNEVTGTAYFDDLRLEEVARPPDGFIQLTKPGSAVSDAVKPKRTTSYLETVLLLLLATAAVNLFFYLRRRKRGKTETSQNRDPHPHVSCPRRLEFWEDSRSEAVFAFLERRILGVRLATLVFFVILLLGMAIRLYAFGKVPPGINQDEAAVGYDAFALANYGIDRNGQSYPVHFVSWGSGQSALYAYLIMPFVKAFGLSSITTRLGNLLLGTLGIVLLFLVGRHTVGIETGLFSAFLLAISPWGIISSRWGLEANILPWIFLVGFYLYLLSFRERAWLVPSFVVFALSLYSYNTAYFVTPFFLLFLAIFRYAADADKPKGLKAVALGLGAFAVVSLPIGAFLAINTIPNGLSALKIFGVTIPKLTTLGTRYRQTVFFDAGTGLTGLMEKMSTYWGYYYDTVFKQTGAIWNVIPRYGNIYRPSIIFFLIGLGISLVKMIRSLAIRELKQEMAMIVWFLLGTALGILSEVNTNRINIIFPPMLFFAAYGVVESALLLGGVVSWLARQAVRPGRFKAIVQEAFIGLCLLAYLNLFISFVGYYFREYPAQISVYNQESFAEALRYVEERNRGEKEVVISKFNMAYIYVLFYARYPAHLFVKTVRYDDPGAEFRQVHSFGHYRFAGFDAPVAVQADTFYIVENEKVQNFPLSQARTIRRFKRFTVVAY